MKTYRMNSFMAGALYVLGTVFGVTGAILGGEVITSVLADTPMQGVDLLAMAGNGAGQFTLTAFFTLLMGVSLSAMTVFLYPIFRKDSEELAATMLLFRGALEGAYYFIAVLAMLTMAALGVEYVASGADSAALHSMGNVVYQFTKFSGHAGTFLFLIGAVALYISFYRTRLIPRWLSIWGLVGAVPFWLNAALHVLNVDIGGIGIYIEMPLAIQEIVMGLWLVIKGFDQAAVRKLDGTD